MINERLDGQNGSVGGVTGDGSTSFSAEIGRFRLSITRDRAEAAGFGDGGRRDTVQGWHQWSFSAAGWATRGTSGVALLQGTADFTGTVALVADNGHTYYGTAAIVTRVDTVDMDNADIPTVITGVGKSVLVQL